jgi:hypothetical protein
MIVAHDQLASQQQEQHMPADAMKAFNLSAETKAAYKPPSR